MRRIIFQKCLFPLQIEYIRGSLKVLSSTSRDDNGNKERYVVVLNADANELRIRLPEQLQRIDDSAIAHGKLTLHLNEVCSCECVCNTHHTCAA